MHVMTLGLVAILAVGLLPAFAQQYPGTTLTLLIHAGHFAIPWQQRAPIIKDRFGIDIKVVGIDVNDMYKKQLLELTSGTGAFDILQYNPAWLGDYASYLQPLDELMKQYPVDWEDIISGFRTWHSTFGGRVYGLVMDGDVLLMY